MPYDGEEGAMLIGYDAPDEDLLFAEDDMLVGDDGVVYEVGDDGMLYEVGRRGRRRRRGRRSRRRAKRRLRRAPREAVVKPATPPLRSAFKPDGLRVQPMPLGLVIVPANSTAQLIATAQKQIQGERLSLVAIDTVTGLASDSILVNDFKVGTVSQLAGVVGLPLSTFREQAVGTRLETTVATPGIDITLFLENLSPNDVSVAGALIGRTR